MKNILYRMINRGQINCVTPTGASWAGPGSNSFNANLAPATGPMGGGANSVVVPDPASSVRADPNSPSKIIPGQSSDSPPDPLSPDAQKLDKGPSPLDSYTNLFDNSPVVDANGKEIKVAAPAKTILDAGAIDYTKAAEKIDFTKNVTPDQLTDMAKGGEEGVKAMMATINSIAQGIYVQAGTTASLAASKSVEVANSDRTKAVTEQIHLNDVSALVIAGNPQLAEPQLKPMSDALQLQLTKKNPSKTAREIADLALGYIDLLQKQAEPDKDDPANNPDPNGLIAFFNQK